VVTSIVFSKNRPLQLDLTLKTIARNFNQCSNVIVVYTADSEYLAAYEILKKEHPEIDWRYQTSNLYKMIYCALSSLDCKNDFACFLTDDCIVYRKVPDISGVLQELKTSSDTKCISLRLGMNINQQSHEGVTRDCLPRWPIYQDSTSEWIIFNHFQNLFGSYWCYPMSVDGHIYNRSDLKNMINELCVLNRNIYSDWPQNPNCLEEQLQRFLTINGHNTIAPFNSCVVNSPNNTVQNSHPQNRSGDQYSMEAKFLLSEFNKGKRIKFDNLDFTNIRCPHTEINIMNGVS